jgi:hypothetical protein
VELLLFYPALTRFTCAECQQFVYDVDWDKNCAGTGQRKTYRGGTCDLRRGKNSPPPCFYDAKACPKGSPAEEQEHVLSPENWQAWQLYREVRATNGACLTDAMRADRLLMQNLSILDEMARVRERQQLGREVASNLLPLMFRR